MTPSRLLPMPVAQAALRSPPPPLAVRSGSGSVRAPHPVELSGLRPSTRPDALPPTLVERRDADPVEALLVDLADTVRRDALLARPAYQRGTVRRLFAPVQRVMNCVVLEAFCQVPGRPRLDPARIDSAGFVLRRVLGAERLAWLLEGPKAFGWDPVADPLQDPLADRRPLGATLGHPALDSHTPAMARWRSAGSARLAKAVLPVSEAVQPLFVAPPDVCAAAGKTLLFGTLSFPGDERSEAPPTPPVYGATAEERQALQAHLSPFLKAHAGALAVPGLGGRTVTARELADDRNLAGLRSLVEQLHQEFDAFDGSGSAAKALRQALAVLAWPQKRSDRTVDLPAWPLLGAAKTLLFDNPTGTGTLAVPERFAALPSQAAATLFDALLAQLAQRHTQVLAASSRYEADGSDVQYVLCAFVRLKPEHAGCPGRLLWAAESAPFTLAAWYESAGVPVPVVPMPDPTDRALLASLKPGVAFRVPAKLAGLLRADPEKLAKGEGDAVDLGVDWVCSFSIPIITICAFIVLNIFLQLLNLVFWWLPFLKVCLPVPKQK